MLTEGRARLAFELLDQTGLLARGITRGFSRNSKASSSRLNTIRKGTSLFTPSSCSPSNSNQTQFHDPRLGSAPPRHRQARHLPAALRSRATASASTATSRSAWPIAAEICRRLRFSNDETAQILALVQNHMRFADTPRMKASTLKRFVRLNRFEEHLLCIGDGLLGLQPQHARQPR